MDVVKGRFIKRLNRFVVQCLINDKKELAYLPNPGRLLEILLPDTLLYLLPQKGKSRYRFVIYGAEKDRKVVMLHTHYTNEVARWLISEGLIPELRGYQVKKQEVSFGNSRFDFLLSGKKGNLLLEVKSCTLFHRGIAMFPDAPTERGKRHIVHLSESGKGAVLFVIHDPETKLFVPDYHTDPDFARTLYSLRKEIQVLAVALGWSNRLKINTQIRPVSVGLESIESELDDSGYYAVLLKLDRDRLIETGSLGAINFPEGFYVYIGSARGSLSSRIKRHLRARKKMHWHIDYLRKYARVVHSFPIRSSVIRECELAEAIKRIADWQIPGFGSSDCNCNTHLFGFKNNPVQNRAFINTVLDFRIMEIERKTDKI